MKGRNFKRRGFCLFYSKKAVEAKTKPKLTAKKKTMTVGQTYKLKLKGVPGKAKMKWKTSKKSVISISKQKGNTVTLKAKKKGTAVVTAAYKKKKYKCRITVKAKKRTEPTADNPVLNSSDVTLYYLSEEYKGYITYDSSHLREYRFRISGTQKRSEGLEDNWQRGRLFQNHRLWVVADGLGAGLC